MLAMKPTPALLALWDDLASAMRSHLEWVERGQPELADDVPTLRQKITAFEEALTGRPADANQRAKSIVDQVTRGD